MYILLQNKLLVHAINTHDTGIEKMELYTRKVDCR